jgi:cyclopropane-fatty-acyl-phospholipid synthase
MSESFARFEDRPESGASPRSITGRLARRVLAAAGDPSVRLRLWTGEVVQCTDTPLATLELRDAGALWRLLRDPDRGFGYGYTSGRIGFAGDLTEFLADVSRRVAARRAGQGLAFRPRRQRVRPKAIASARANVHHHYDIGNDFYRLWLDPTLSYTCAYYPTAQATLVEAQQAKIHHVARKLRLKPGELVVEAGCGWGGFALTVAQHYGVRVRAFNISHEQIEHARAAARASGLAGQVEFIEDDYRNIPGSVTGRCDAFVSIGMLEHVGIAHYAELGHLVTRLLEPHGRGLIHSIGRNAAEPVSGWIHDRIFPGGEVPSLAEMVSLFAPDELSVIDVENLRPHYALTLRDWLDAFERSVDQVRRMFDEEFVRTWRLYLAGSRAAFLTGDMQLFQVLFAPRSNQDWALTRAHLYTK